MPDNARDLKAIMAFFADDRSLDVPRGPDPRGGRSIAGTAMREGLSTRLTGLPGVQHRDDRRWAGGDNAVSEKLRTGTTPAGIPVRERGRDHCAFRDGPVTRKDSCGKSPETPA